MNTDSTEGMVLRTVFLPLELDQALKHRASKDNTSRENIIRTAVTNYLSAPKPPVAPTRTSGLTNG